MRKPAIPSVQPVQDQVVASILVPVKENIEVLTGVRGGPISPLLPGASNAQIIDKVNEIIKRLNFNAS